MGWLRRFVRRNTAPIDELTAHKWKRKLSVAYAILAWNALGMVAWAWYKGAGDWADYYGLKSEEEKMMPNNEYFARTLGRSGDLQLITMKGFTITEKRDFDYDTEKERESKKKNVDLDNKQELVNLRRQLLQEEYERLKKEKEDKALVG